MLLCKLGEIWQAGHRPVFIQYLADHRGGLKPRGLGQITTRLGMAGAHQDAPWTRHQGKYVPGLNQVRGPRLPVDGSLNGTRPIAGRNTGRDAFGRLDR